MDIPFHCLFLRFIRFDARLPVEIDLRNWQRALHPLPYRPITNWLRCQWIRYFVISRAKVGGIQKTFVITPPSSFFNDRLIVARLGDVWLFRKMGTEACWDIARRDWLHENVFCTEEYNDLWAYDQVIVHVYTVVKGHLAYHAQLTCCKNNATS